MKFEAKRGIGWHWCLCLYFKYEERPIDKDGVTSTTGSAVRYTVYCDQILEGSNKQDGLAVLSMLEAFLKQLSVELPHIRTVTLQSDNAGCYQAKELLLLIAILNTSSQIRIVRFIHTETQDGKGLIDAHFAKGTAHLMKFMKTSQQNRIRTIATAKGLAAALAWGGGIQNSFVQLITLDREKLQKLSAAIGKVVKEAKGYFARCNDTFYMECEGKWATQKLTGIEELTKAEIVFNIRCFAYSGIGDGVTFRTSLKTGLFRPCSCNASVNDLEAASKDDDDESTDIGGEELSVDANEVADYIFHVEGDDNKVEDQDEGEENDEDEIYSEDEDNEIAPAGFSGYGESDLLRGAELLTGACIQKRSCLSNIMGPRNQHRSVCNPHAGPGNGQLIRQDMVAAAVRLASILITHHSVNITNGHSEMEEYNQAAHLEISEKNHNHKHQGWARHPQRGAQYGRAYLEPYKKDTKRMFERGARVSSDKMSPSAMLEELQSLYPGRYTLPGENEIRAEITKLFGRKKASDEDNAGSDHDESENEATKGRGSNLPKQYVKHLEELVERNPTIKPAEALRNLKAALCLPHPFEHDKAIKTKVSSLKRKRKVTEKTNIL